MFEVLVFPVVVRVFLTRNICEYKKRGGDHRKETGKVVKYGGVKEERAGNSIMSHCHTPTIPHHVP